MPRQTPSRVTGPALVSGVLFAAAAAPLAAQTGSVDVHDVTLPYEVQGSGPPLVLIHGWAVNHHFWDGVADSLARHYTVIRYDRRGFGTASGKPDVTADPADLAALLRHLGHARAHVMGHSQGAAVALTFAVRFPEMVNGLVLYGVGPVPGLDVPPADDTPPFAEWVAAGRTYGPDSLRAAIMRWGAKAFGGPLTPEMVERATELLGTYSGADLIDPAPPSNPAAVVQVNEVATVRAPTLIVNGALEASFNRVAGEAYASRIPGAEHVEIPGGGHVVSWQEPERFLAAVLDFLRRVDARR